MIVKSAYKGDEKVEMFRTWVRDDSALVGWGISALLATSEGKDSKTAQCLSSMGVRVTAQDELYDALSSMLDDPFEAELLVIDCDSFGGIEVGRRVLAILAEAGQRVPVILVSSECEDQKISEGRDQPSLLRAPVSAVAMRSAFEAAFRSKMRALIP